MVHLQNTGNDSKTHLRIRIMNKSSQLRKSSFHLSEGETKHNAQITWVPSAHIGWLYCALSSYYHHVFWNSAKYKVTSGIRETARRSRRGGRYYFQKQRYNGIFTPVHIFSGVCCTVRSLLERGLKQGFSLGAVKNERRNWTELNGTKL
jgi:hypothetical protein